MNLTFHPITMTKFIITTVVCSVLSLSSGFAKGKGKGKAEKGDKKAHAEAVFAKLDGDKDGSLTLEEFSSGKKATKKPEKAKKHFAKLDKDNNSKVSKEEFLAGAKDHAEKGKKGKGKDKAKAKGKGKKAEGKKAGKKGKKGKK